MHPQISWHFLALNSLQLFSFPDGASDGDVALPGHDGGHVDGVVEDAVLGRVEDEGEEHVREVRVDVDVLQGKNKSFRMKGGKGLLRD